MSSYSHIDQDDILKEVVSLIHQVDNTTNLRRVVDEVKQRRIEIGQSIKYKLSPGDKVFVTSRTEGKEEGLIQKVNRTRAVVKIGPTAWNVPFSMIEKI